jgi:flagellar assembly factor FliW
VRERLEEITVNLQGPLLVNPVSLLGRQLVLEEYPVRYPLIQPESAK